MTRASSGVYLVGPGPPDLLDHARAALAVCPPGAVVGFHTAAALLGFGVVEDEVVHVVVPAGSPVPDRRGIRVHQSVVPAEPVEVGGVPCAPAARTAIDLARVLPRPQALSFMDAALASGASSHDALRAEVAEHAGLRGIRKVRDLVELADGRSACAQESHLRLALHDAGLRSFVPQVPVFDGGHTRYYLDLADPERRVAAEYDGASHQAPGALRNDRERHNWLSGRGWEMRYFTGYDLYRRPWYVVQTMGDALSRRPTPTRRPRSSQRD